MSKAMNWEKARTREVSRARSVPKGPSDKQLRLLGELEASGARFAWPVTKREAIDLIARLLAERGRPVRKPTSWSPRARANARRERRNFKPVVRTVHGHHITQLAPNHFEGVPLEVSRTDQPRRKD